MIERLGYIITENNYIISLLSFDREKGEIVYLGYPLELTKKELAIFFAIVDSGKKGITASCLAEKIGSKNPQNENSIAVHVHNINSKAQKIGNRNIILEKRRVGYLLTDKL